MLTQYVCDPQVLDLKAASSRWQLLKMSANWVDNEVRVILPLRGEHAINLCILAIAILFLLLRKLLSSALHITMDVSAFGLHVSPLLLLEPGMLSEVTHCGGIGLPFFFQVKGQSRCNERSLSSDIIASSVKRTCKIHFPSDKFTPEPRRPDSKSRK